MAKQLESDRILFGAVVALVLFGCLMVYSASAVLAAEQYGSSYHFLLRQVFWAILGLALMLVMMNVEYPRLASPLVVFPRARHRAGLAGGRAPLPALAQRPPLAPLGRGGVPSPGTGERGDGNISRL